MSELAGRPSSVTSRLKSGLRTLKDPFDLAAVVSLVVLVPSPARAGMLLATALALTAAVVVVMPQARRTPWPWLVFAVFHAVTYATRWYLLDNHDALVAYWAVALVIAATGRRNDLLALQARLLLGLTFALATGWKIVSGQFLNGDFFTLALLVDPRFRGVTETLAGVPVEQVHANADSLASAGASLTPGSVPLTGVEAVAAVAVVLTVATLVIEAAVALAMLLPEPPTGVRLRSLLLAAFLVGTYVIVPVSRFGILLAAMGVAQAAHSPRVRIGFAAGAFGLMVWGTLWMRLIGLT